MKEHEVAVIGLGGIGSATAYWLARSGVSVAGFEQFELGHARGASHDHSRIIRRSYHTPSYVELTAEAYDAWASVEADGGSAIVTRTGGIDLFPADAAIDPAPYRSSLETVGVPYEWIDASEIRRRWPAFEHGSTVSDGVSAIYSADTGIVPAGRATTELQRLAVAHGAALFDRSPVRSLREVGGEGVGGEMELVVERDGALTTMRVGAVVICADAWTNQLLADLGRQVPLAVLREQVSYYPARAGGLGLHDLAIGQFPVWIWMHDPSFYGFPVYGVDDAAKGAEDCGGFEVDPDLRTFDPDVTMEQRLGQFMSELVGDRFARPRSTTCLYTLTSDRDFVLDRLPGMPHVSVALGAAHGFKFAAWFGRELAALAHGAPSRPELSAFAFDRPGLHAPIDRAAWLV